MTRPGRPDTIRAVLAAAARQTSRVAGLVRGFLREADDPAPFYRQLATEAVERLGAEHGPFAGRTLLDLGAGPGWYAEAFEAAGARVLAVEADAATLRGHGARPRGPVAADAGRLPVADGRVDGVICSNLLEHTPAPDAVWDEIGRVLRPGGWAWVSWTNWYGPWGGHELSPFHYLGPDLGTRVHDRLRGPARVHRIGRDLFPVHVGPTLRHVAAHPALDLVRAEPRYWPWARAVLRVPGVREVVTWNCAITVRRR